MEVFGYHMVSFRRLTQTPSTPTEAIVHRFRANQTKNVQLTAFLAKRGVTLLRQPPDAQTPIPPAHSIRN